MRLLEYINEQGIEAIQFGRIIGLKDPRSVYRWLEYRDEKGVTNACRQVPAKEYMLKIWKLTKGKVAPNDFYDLA